MTDSSFKPSSEFGLPPEIWLHIISIAAAPVLPLSYRQPFDRCSSDLSGYQQSLDTKCALARVSKMFREFTTPYLYSELNLATATNQLCQLLDNDNRGYGRYVRTIIIPYSSTQTPTPKSASLTLAILRHCSNAHAIVRPPPYMCNHLLRYEFEIEDLPVQVHNLKSLYWHHSEMAASSGGLNNIHEVLSKVPNLEYLSIRGALGRNYTRNGPTKLQNLRALHIRGVNPLFARQISLWPMPTLRHIIVDCAIPNRALELIWTALGCQLHTVEFGYDLSFMLNDDLAACLRGCPDLQHLILHPFFHLPFDIPEVHNQLSTVSMHLRPNEMLRQSSPDAEWAHFETFLTRFLGPTFPALKTLQLFGDWELIEFLFRDHRFSELRHLAQSCGCTLKVMSPNGTLVRIPVC